jgi:hypothetical protein
MKPTSRKPSGQPLETGVPGLLNLSATATIELTADGSGEANKGLPRFRMVAYTGAPMRIAGWRYPVVLDLAGLTIPSQSRPIRFGHDPLSGVGHTDAIRIEDGQLTATGVVSRDTAAAREIVISAKNGFPWQASVGAGVEEFEFIKENQKVVVNGRALTGPLNVVRKATLGEISFVDLGADGQTSAIVAATNPPGDAPVNTADANTDVAGTVSPQAPAPSADPQPTVEEVRAQALAETSRIAAIRRVCAGRHADIEARAIQEGWDATRCELEILRADRPRSPAVHIADNTITATVLEAACLLTAKLGQVEELYEPQTLDLAARRFRGGIGLQELLLEAAWANGYTGRNFRDHRAVLRFAFARGIEASFSTIDIGGILSNVANKFLLEGFFSVERTWRNITAVRNVSDFKTVTSYRLIGKDQYELVAPGGELKHGTLGEEKYENRADTYGLLLSIDRRLWAIGTQQSTQPVLEGVALKLFRWFGIG